MPFMSLDPSYIKTYIIVVWSLSCLKSKQMRIEINVLHASVKLNNGTNIIHSSQFLQIRCTGCVSTFWQVEINAKLTADTAGTS